MKQGQASKMPTWENMRVTFYRKSRPISQKLTRAAFAQPQNGPTRVKPSIPLKTSEK